MRKAVTDGTVYDDLDAWGKSQGMDADTAIEAAVDAFYQTNLADERLLGFFGGVDLVASRSISSTFCATPSAMDGSADIPGSPSITHTSGSSRN